MDNNLVFNTELEFFIRWSTDKDKYDRYVRQQEEITMLHKDIDMLFKENKTKEQKINSYIKLVKGLEDFISLALEIYDLDLPTLRTIRDKIEELKEENEI